MLIICVHCDNQFAIERAQNSMYNSKSKKNIHHRHNIIKHFLLNGIISFDYIKSKKNIVNPLTKSLSRELVYNLLGEG